MTMMTMMTVIDNVVDHYTYQTRWGQKRTHAKIHPVTYHIWQVRGVYTVYTMTMTDMCLAFSVFFGIRPIEDDALTDRDGMYQYLNTFPVPIHACRISGHLPAIQSDIIVYNILSYTHAISICIIKRKDWKGPTSQMICTLNAN